jgi:HEAT repeat protein
LEFSRSSQEGNRKSVGKAADIALLISDPDTRVRCNAVRALAASADPKGLAAVAAILSDRHEIDSVVKSVIQGLGESHGATSLQMLLEKSSVNDEYVLDCIEALSNRRAPDDLQNLVDAWLAAGATAKYILEKVFERNGEICTPLLDSLLESKTGNFGENVQAIFYATGFLDRLGYRLRSRNREERLLAVKKLGQIGSLKAARSLVLALRDPDAGIRAKVIEILGTLNTDFSSHLGELTHDPDRKVRQYAVWAIERMSPVSRK